MQLLAALLADPAVSPLLTEFDDSVEFIHPHSAHELLRGQLSIEREWGDTPVLAIFRLIRGQKSIAGVVDIAAIGALRGRMLVNINATDKDGNTVLHWAARDGETEDVALLLDVGADKTIKDRRGKLPHQHLKASQKQIKALLNSRALFKNERKNKWMFTPPYRTYAQAARAS